MRITDTPEITETPNVQQETSDTKYRKVASNNPLVKAVMGITEDSAMEAFEKSKSGFVNNIVGANMISVPSLLDHRGSVLCYAGILFSDELKRFFEWDVYKPSRLAGRLGSTAVPPSIHITEVSTNDRAVILRSSSTTIEPNQTVDDTTLEEAVMAISDFSWTSTHISTKSDDLLRRINEGFSNKPAHIPERA